MKNYPGDWASQWYDSQVTMAFTLPHSGWIDLVIVGTPRGAVTRIAFSNVFDPLPDFIGWLRKIAALELPAELEIEQEGPVALFQALSIPGRPDWIELTIGLKPDDDSEEKFTKVLYLSRANRRQLVREFCRRFEEWRRTDYTAVEWHKFGIEHDDSGEACDDPLTFDLAALKSFAQAVSD